ncbi:NAD-dependent epimerase/dehydratase family protein [Petroclostridium sp. X23]|uniref:NAD-dependent epimerase/dehydratase family protein n=1 Tax=Petroclostridium sp. X23 TaxID=3045146 RepID=UPI0024AE0213|nr:NAD-dependent epimerase/dehydratase family protein [Petroclostridium sp. X23]WHH57419.1 NAD-dependent epimerase/dehydratase family protein [Petroclostridium sp. X23]
MTMQTCLVMGAGGFIGKALCKKLAKEYKVLAYDIRPIEELKDVENIKIVTGNFIEEKNFQNILDGVDKVFHLISTTIPSESTKHIDIEIEHNIIPTVRLLEGMVACGVNEIIFASSGGTIYGETGNHINCVDDRLNPICSYGVQKKVIESYLEFYGIRYGINYKIARISNPYGLGQNPDKPQGVIPIFIKRLFNNEPITIFGDGNNERDYIYMDDLMDALIALTKYSGDKHIFNIGSGQVHTLNEIIESIEKQADRKFILIKYADMRKCDVSKTLLETKTSQAELKWKPRISLNNGISVIVNGHIQHKNKIDAW